MSKSELVDDALDMINIFRQSGTTTALVGATLQFEGYLVVGTNATKKRLLLEHPALKDSVFVINTLKIDMLGRKKAPLFFDNDALAILLSGSLSLHKEDPIPVVKFENPPTQADLEVWRDIFKDSVLDPNFKVFTHTGNTAAAPYINIGSGSSYITWTGGNTATTTKI